MSGHLIGELIATEEESTVIAHLRGHCHMGGDNCRLCVAETRAFKAEQALESVISG